MQYWIFTIGLLVIIIAIIITILILLLKKGIKDNDENLDNFKTFVILGCISIVCFLPFAIDLPSALCGDEEIYVNELPTRHNCGGYLSTVKTDNKQLKHLKLGEWEKYEKYGNYRIRYTKPIKFVLDIEPIE